MERALVCVLAVACFLAGSLRPVEGQILSVGARVSYITEVDLVIQQGTLGLGGQAVLGFPVIGLKVQGTLDFYFPDCEGVDCDLRDVGLNGLWTLPIPVVDPYLGAGVAVIRSSVEGEDDTDVGLNLLLGLGFRRLFVETKLQLLQDLDNQLVLTGGVSLPIL